jgi:hypothetical protein
MLYDKRNDLYYKNNDKKVIRFTLDGSCQAASLSLWATDPGCLGRGAAHVRLLSRTRISCTVVVLSLSYSSRTPCSRRPASAMTLAQRLIHYTSKPSIILFFRMRHVIGGYNSGGGGVVWSRLQPLSLGLEFAPCLRHSATMEKIFSLPKRWILFWRWKSRPTVNHLRTYDDSLEMQVPLTTRRTKIDCNAEAAYEPHDKKPKTLFDRKSPRWGLDRYFGPRFAGWRFGVLNFAVCASVVFLINLIAMIWGSTATLEAKGVFFEGDCERVERLNTGLHLLINALGTILLAGR